MTQIRKHHRPKERARLKARFGDGSSVLMLAPRRIGKTWLLDALRQDMAEAGWLCVRLDLQGMTTEAQFLRALCSAIEATSAPKEWIWAQLRQRFSQAVQRAGEGDLTKIIGQLDHREFMETLIAGLDRSGRPTLLLIDELSLFVNDLAKADANGARTLLYELRRLRDTYKTVRWFMTGSIGLDAVARQHAIEGALLGIDVTPLEPFDETEARSFIDELFERFGSLRRFTFTADGFRHLVDSLGWLSPYHVEHVVKLIEPPDDEDPRVNVDHVEAAINRLLEPWNRIHFAGWREHIAKNFPADQARIMTALLDVLCERPDGETVATLLSVVKGSDPAGEERKVKDALLGLQADAFLARRGERWAFRSGILRRFWREYEKA